MKLRKFEKEIRKYADAHTPDVLESVLKAQPVKEETRLSKPIKRRYTLVMRYGTAAAVIAVLLVSVILFNQVGRNPILTPLTPGMHTNEVKLSTGTIYFNTFEIRSGARRYVPEDVYQLQITMEEYIRHIGRDPRPSWFPGDLKEAKTELVIWYYPDGKIFDSSNYLYYSTDPEDYTAKKIGITVEKDTLPLQDYILAGENMTSLINGVEVRAGYLLMDENYNEDGQPESYFDYYYADFISKGIGYRITAERGITQEEFIKVILSLIG
jgi:hypothetical protein